MGWRGISEQIRHFARFIHDQLCRARSHIRTGATAIAQIALKIVWERWCRLPDLDLDSESRVVAIKALGDRLCRWVMRYLAARLTDYPPWSSSKRLGFLLNHAWGFVCRSGQSACMQWHAGATYLYQKRLANVTNVVGAFNVLAGNWMSVAFNQLVLWVLAP